MPEFTTKIDKGPMQCETTNMHDFKAHDIRRIHLHSPDKYKRPEGEMETTTSYNKDYAAKQGHRPGLIKHDGLKVDGGFFDGRPSYTDDYRRWEIQRVFPIRKNDVLYEAPNHPFQGQSSYEKDFIRHLQAPRKPIKPDSMPLHSGEPFEDHTAYKEDFVRHLIPIKENKAKDEYKQNKTPLESMTTNRRDFTPKLAERVKPFKIESTAHLHI